MTTIGLLAHDLSDPAIDRRVRMLEAGGATVKIAGFLRGKGRPIDALVRPSLCLGRTHDARLVRRSAGIARVLLTRMTALKRHLDGIDVLIARNLEMLVVAARLVCMMRPRPRLVYECLDIHRLLTAPGVAGNAIRQVERIAGRGVDLVVTSSPAFIDNHLGRGVFSGRTMIVENKVPAFATGALQAAPNTPPGPPWRIGWFGILRCRRSLDLLSELARRAEGRVEVILRGRPSPTIFPDLARDLSGCPNVVFGGAYDGARDLARIYEKVHFAWCIDFYEKDANSRWLLPNRLYESAYHGTVPVALGQDETGRFLRRHALGVVLDNAEPDSLLRTFAGVDAADYAAQIAQLGASPRSMWSTDPGECRRLVETLAGLGRAPGDEIGEGRDEPG